jgi:limonene-1,2-epoxide hydrolase
LSEVSESGARNESVIRAFVEAWSRLDPEELADFFSEDGIYHNVPMGPVAGRDNVKQLIAGFTAAWTATEWDLIHIASAGNIVFTERLDRTQAGDKGVDLPCVGVFEMEGGKIKVWRDYFDLATYQKGLG